MSRRDVRVVIGEGGSSRRGLLRFVLEGEGFEVVGEADRHADLVHVVALLKPDVVVLDDGIGVAAVGMAREIAPHAKVVLVWPRAVVPIGGDARVEPSRVVQELGPAVERVAAALIGPVTESYRRPDWVDRVRKDPAALREMLSSSGAATTAFSVSQLQRRIADAERRERERRQPEPVAAGQAVVHDDEGAAVLILSEEAAAADVTPVPPAERDRARRLGAIALGAAAVSAALVFALALGGRRIPVLVLGESPGSAVSPSPPPPDGTSVPPENGNGDGNGGNGDQRPGGNQDQQSYAPTPSGPTVGPGDGGNPGDQGGHGGGGDHDGDGEGDGDGIDTVDGLPGNSALHNPYGGPPGILGFTPKPWMFTDGTPGLAGEHGRASDATNARGHGWGLRSVDDGGAARRDRSAPDGSRPAAGRAEHDPRPGRERPPEHARGHDGSPGPGLDQGRHAGHGSPHAHKH